MVLKVCKRCGKRKRKLSGNNICLSCSMEAVRSNIIGLREKEGNNYNKWMTGIVNFTQRQAEISMARSKKKPHKHKKVKRRRY